VFSTASSARSWLATAGQGGSKEFPASIPSIAKANPHCGSVSLVLPPRMMLSKSDGRPLLIAAR